MRAAVIAAGLLIAATLASAQTYSEIKFELQLDAVSRDGGPWARDRILPADNRYDDEWITIAWERAKFSFAMENRSGSPLDILWDGARLAVDGAAEQRLVHGGIFLSDRRKPQGKIASSPGRTTATRCCRRTSSGTTSEKPR